MSDIPFWTRASDIRTLILSGGCQGSWILQKLYADELPDAVWFILGTSIHTAIEETITNDLSLEDMKAEAHMDKMMMLAIAGDNIIESASKRAKRGLHTINDDIDRMCDKWWKDVHPSSKERLPVYNNYAWPPTVEHIIDVGKDETRLITQIDALFHGNDKFGEAQLIVDWKSGATKKAAPSQLHTYAYGLQQEGLFDADGQVVVGLFHHIDHSAVQWVHDYWGDDVVAAHIRSTYANKDRMLSSGDINFAPDWWCGYCVAREKCPIEGQGNYQEITVRLGAAVRQEEPANG